MKSNSIALFLLLFFISAFSVHAQDERPEKKGKLVGFGFGFADFYTPSKIKTTSLKEVLDKGGWTKMNESAPTMLLMYWQGITRRLDYSIRYNLVFTDYTKDSHSQDASHEFEGAFHLRALTDNHTFNPFITAGAGIGTYGRTWAPYSPVGIGLQVNLESTTYIFLQGNYRISYIKDALDNNLMYSLGITETISKSKEPRQLKTVPIPAVEKKDADNDGVEDGQDQCPDAAGSAQLNGCPDADSDGIADKDDQCPQQQGTAKYQGCPVPDSDGDGINDENDKCPQQKGTGKYDGCPVPDSDGDGVNDENDRCPSLAGVASNNGCPEVKEETKKKISYSAQQLYFATGSDKLLAKSYPALDQVAKILKEDENLQLEVEGHTDATGSQEKNLVLSEKRAQSVANYLIGKGVDENRLKKTGFGASKPIAPNTTAAGRNKNRRVELKLTY